MSPFVRWRFCATEINQQRYLDHNWSDWPYIKSTTETKAPIAVRHTLSENIPEIRPQMRSMTIKIAQMDVETTTIPGYMQLLARMQVGTRLRTK